LIAGLAAPIFRGGALRADSARAEAAAQERLAAYTGVALIAWREAENALAAETRLLERAAQLRISFEEAARAEELAQRQYTNGLVDIFNLLDAQGRRISSESQYIAVRRERAANRVRLYLAIGGDFTAPEYAAASAGESAS
jgi:outer membrane protein TolC